MTDVSAARLPVPPRAAARRYRGKIIGFLLLAVPVALAAGYTWATLAYSYSSGERVGYVQKLSRKGWFCKTWEGELAMATVPGVAPEVFTFSIRSDAVAEQVNRVQGQRVALYYAQHRGVPSRCFGETEYFVTGVRHIGD